MTEPTRDVYELLRSLREDIEEASTVGDLWNLQDRVEEIDAALELQDKSRISGLRQESCIPAEPVAFVRRDCDDVWLEYGPGLHAELPDGAALYTAPPAALIAERDAMSKALLAEYSREDLAKFLSSMQAACESLEGTIKELRAKIAEQAAEIERLRQIPGGDNTIYRRLRDADALGVAPPQNWTTAAADQMLHLHRRAEAAEAALAGAKAQMSDEQIIRLCSAAKAQALREAAGRFDRAVNEVFGRNGVAQELDRLASEHERS